MTKRYVLIAYDDGDDNQDRENELVVYVLAPDGEEIDYSEAEVTDLVTYNKTTPGDPWDKPYPAMYTEMMERLA